MSELTDRQAAVLAFLRSYTAAEGIAPTVREIMAHFGWTSFNAPACHLQALVKKGHLTHTGFKSRAYRLAGCQTCPHCHGTGRVP